MPSPQLPATLRATQCFARPGDFGSMIDMVNPDTGLSCVHGESLEQIRLRYPSAIVMDYAQWSAGGVAAEKAALTAATWKECTANHFEEMLNILPPARWESGAFLVGEPVTHCRQTGAARFRMFRQNRAGQHLELSEPVTSREFSHLLAHDFIF